MAFNEDRVYSLVGSTKKQLTIFSNETEGRVSINYQSFRPVEFENGMSTMSVDLVSGKNTIELTTAHCSLSKTIDVALISDLKSSMPNRFGINVGSHFNFYDPELDIEFIADRPYTSGLFGYLDGEPYLPGDDKYQGIPHNIKNTDLEPLYQTMLMGTNSYQLDVSKGSYKVTLYFVEPKLRSQSAEIYSLGSDQPSAKIDNGDQRIFDVMINGEIVQKHLDLSSEYPDKYGVMLTKIMKVTDQQGLKINLKPIVGAPVISGILIEKTN